jgi:hypothetical protein
LVLWPCMQSGYSMEFIEQQQPHTQVRVLTQTYRDRHRGVYSHKHTETDTGACTHTNIQRQTQGRVLTQTYRDRHRNALCAQRGTQKHTHACTNTHTPPQTHTHWHVHTHTHIYTYTTVSKPIHISHSTVKASLLGCASSAKGVNSFS